ncbi:MAG: hypothetical protein FWF02_15040 [Micrococcales bacterium]|nr:hypothetical protein [Micrococcales bacterium]MCL2668995.1 hypothetical protein [Micrococcales bacterium]
MFTYTYSTNSPNPKPMSPEGIAWMRLFAVRSWKELDQLEADCGHYPGIGEAITRYREFHDDEDRVREALAAEEAEIDEWIDEHREWIRDNVPGGTADREVVRQVLRNRDMVIKITVRPRDDADESE